ncbi:MAG: hypothetical protein E3J52_10440 [Promethearchaeota archaeon]|nr:MAG: hypothetical protein E3J52_10440 [Candidatus Lokiarchaeota archaeon]
MRDLSVYQYSSKNEGDKTRTEIKTRKDMYQNEFYDIYVNGIFKASYTNKLQASIYEKEIIENTAKGIGG